MVNSHTLGKPISETEITNISSHGVWLISGDEEYFLSYEDFPWFKDVAIGKILNIEVPSPGHFYWPDLDVDVSIEIIKNPESYPLRAK